MDFHKDKKTKEKYKSKKKERAHHPSLSRLSVCHPPKCATACSRHTGCQPSEGSHRFPLVKNITLVDYSTFPINR